MINLNKQLKFSISNLSSIVHVALVPKNHLLHICTCMLLNIPDPVLDVVKTLLIGDVIDQHDPHGPPVVGRGDGPEPLLACRVPDLQLDFLAIQLDSSDLEINS